MNKNEFFRDATLRICGHLEIEIALHESLKYLKAVLPIDSMNLSVWEPEMSSLRVIARATLKEGKRLDTLIPMSEMEQNYFESMRNRFLASKWPDADIING